MDRKISRDIADKKSKIIGMFNLNMKKLIKLTNNLVPDNKELQLLDAGASRLNSHLGDTVLLKVGPELYSHRKCILNQNFSFLTKLNYENELRKYEDEFRNGKNKMDEYIMLTTVLVSVYNTCSDDELNEIHKLISNLLLEYLLYVKHCKAYPDD